MNISKSGHNLKTADRKEVKRGDILYAILFDASIVKFKVGFWNDGKTGDLYFNKSYNKGITGQYFVTLKGYGGGGFYPCDEDNVYSYYLAKFCYKDFEKAKDKKIKSYMEGLEKINMIKESDLELRTKAY